ncbi:ABC transporter permease [Carboxydichorda subterranea]|uniref:ABC transporter permease n=1 Tax=Carboxydichorda subterranea TaxID=3109565 RepID=UPI0038577B4F
MRQPGPLLGALVLAAVAGMAVLAPVLTPYSPTRNDLVHSLEPPSGAHPMGTDLLGRDVLTRILYGARLSISLGLTVQAVSVALGTALGLLAGYYGRWVDDVVTAVTTVVQAFPGLLFAIAVMAVLGPSVTNVLVALALVGWPTVSRLVRGETLAIKEQLYVEGARAAGAPDVHILLRHVLPNCAGPIIVVATLGLGGTILAEATLSFLGLGVQPPAPSWGSMLADARDRIWDAPWLMLYPGLAIFVTILALNLLGDGLRDVLDPRLRE